ncbi:hypothetical protein [Streptosporangium sp. NPDC051022]|uniref:hypothetical protein n=1 Tax=Streptosporangium sp. NPDC051022 TaxID=3155752 RepID=UPI003436B24B
MSTEAEKRREARRRAARRRVEPDAAPAGETAIRSKPVRITIDLTPELYRHFTEWTSRVARDIDAPRVTHADAIRAFIRVVATEDQEGTDLAAQEQTHSSIVRNLRQQ